MVIRILIILAFFPSIIKAQESSIVIEKEGLLRVQGTISFGKLSSVKENTLFIHGTAEYYTNNSITVRGDIFYYLKPNNTSILELNHQLFAGTSYHFPIKSNFDPYIGFQPGIALTQYSSFIALDNSFLNLQPSKSITPLLSGVVGFNYYASKWFHLFVDGRYIYGKHLSNLPPVNIDEFRISFGLGFNISAK
jgi:hypothetical protein